MINIIIDETKRPLFTQANLAVGSNGYTNIDVTFGGKIGKDKKVANFNFYGSATQYNTRRTVFDKEVLYNPEVYTNKEIYLNMSNYRADSTGILVNDLPHQSRLIGFGIKYKMLRFKAEVMHREDHSSIGLNPAAVSYFNPGNYIGERIFNAELSIGKVYKRMAFESKIGVLDYEMDNRSSTGYVANTLLEVTESVIRNIAFNPMDSTFDQVLYDNLLMNTIDRYFSGNRFSYARSSDFHIDQTFNFFLGDNFEITVGGQLNLIGNVPQVNYAAFPLRYNLFGDDVNLNPQNVPFQPESFFLSETNVFAQAYLTLNKFNFVGGSQFYNHFIYGRSVNPRLAILFKPNKNLGIRAFYGQAFRSPIPFYNSNSYFISPTSQPPISLVEQEFKPEETTSYELGFRWSRSKNFSIDMAGFYTVTENFISSNLILDVPTTQERDFFLGYTNFGESRSTLFGIQSNLVLKNLLPDNKASLVFNITFSDGSEVIPTTFAEQDKIREVPPVIAKGRFTYQPGPRLSFTTDHIFMSSTDNGTRLIDVIFPSALDGVYIMDFLVRYELNNNFKIYIKLNNLFNQEYAGLNASNTPDDLLFNPQELRIFRLGMNYKMN